MKPRRLIGVIIFAIFGIFSGTCNLVISIGFLLNVSIFAVGLGISHHRVYINSGIRFLLAVCLLISSFGLFWRKNWARIFFPFAILLFMIGELWLLIKEAILGSLAILDVIIGLGIVLFLPVLCFWYFNNSN